MSADIESDDDSLREVVDRVVDSLRMELPLIEFWLLESPEMAARHISDAMRIIKTDVSYLKRLLAP